MKGIRFLLENSLFLLIGALAGLVWANVNPESYSHLVHLEILTNDHIGELHDGHRVITLHYLVNDILMALFFAIAGKEVWEATLPGGPLNRPRRAATPLLATLGGILGPAGVYLLGAWLAGDFTTLSSGWAIPTATDIAFSYLVARLIFGASHPAIPFLLLLAIADDAIGLIILAVFYPQEEIRVAWLLVSAGAFVIGKLMARRKIHSFWPYLGAGVISWLGCAKAGIHPALGLLPIIPTMPHAHVDIGLFDWRRLERHDTLTAFEHWWKTPVELILGVFGLLNAGVVLNSFGPATYLVLAGLLIGKPLGVLAMGTLAVKVLGFSMPPGLRRRDLFVIGCASAIGFTVALFIATVAFPAGPVQEAAKMGALASFLAAIVTWVAAKVMGVQKVESPRGAPSSQH